MAMEDIGGIKGEAQLDVGPFERSVKSLATPLDTLNQKMGATQKEMANVESGAKGAGAASTGFKFSIGNLVPQLTAANIATRAFYDGLRLLKLGFTDPINQAAKFQQTMANVSSLIKGDATAQVKAFSSAILELSKTIPKDANDLGAGLYEVVSANFTKTGDALNILNVSAKGAVAGLTDTKTSVDAITTVLNAYQMKASQAQEVSDSLFVAVRDGKMTYEELAGSLGLVVSTAALAKVPLDQMNAALVSLTLAGQQSSHAATDLNMFLDSVIKASKGTNDASKMAKQLGIEYDTTALHAMGLANFIKQVADKAGGSDVAIQTLTGDVRGFRALAVLAGSGTESFNMALEDMKNKAGTADTAFKRNTDTLNNDWILAWNNLNAILIEAGQQQIPGMQSAVQDLTKTINDNKDAIEQAAGAMSESFVDAMREIVKDAPTLIGVLAAIADTVRVVTKAITGFVDAVNGLGRVADNLGAVAGTTLRFATTMPGTDASRAALRQQAIAGQALTSGQDYMALRGQKNETLEQYAARQAALWHAQNDVTQYPPPGGSGGGGGGKPGGGAGGGAGGTKEATKALEDAKRVLADIKKITDDITKTQDEQIKQNKIRVDAEHAELTLKKEMGVITADEQRTLDRLNNRVEYQKDKIKDATDAWKSQVKVVDDLKKKIADITTQIQTVADDLKKTLAGIDTDTAKSKADIVAKLLKEKADIVKASSNAGMTGDQSRRVGEINDQLATADPASLAEGTKLAGMTDLQQADYEGLQKKKQAAQEANAKTAELVSQLTEANAALGAAQKDLKDKIKAVTDAQLAQQVTLTTSYAIIEKATADHVAAQVIQLDLERAHVDALAAAYANVGSYIKDPLGVNGGQPIPGHADGGMITGPGTGTSDSILARLSNGEYVMPAASTAAYRPILDAMRSMRFNIPRFADGGMVTNNSVQKSAAITVNNYGEASKVYADPRRARWHSRTFLG